LQSYPRGVWYEDDGVHGRHVDDEGARDMTTATYTVSGMTCGHCVSSVKEEVSEVDGVQGVEVDLASGSLTVQSEQPVDVAAVRQAVVDAGYELVAP
jgi:copper ion binding protein